MKVEDIQFEKFVRKPFDVAAIQITDDNIEELSKFIGVLEMQENGRYVINVDRKLIRNLDKVYSGYWLTKMGTTLRCYSQNAFAKHFIPAVDPDIWPVENPHTTSDQSGVNAPPLITWNVSTPLLDPSEPEAPLQSQDIFE